MKLKLGLVTIVLILALFGCTDSNYVELNKMDSSFNVGSGFSIPNVSMPAFVPSDFSFNEGFYVFTNDTNYTMQLSLSNKEFGEQWTLLAGGDESKVTFCKDTNCETYDFRNLICLKGLEAGQNVNYYYCKALFYRKLITDDGYIHPEEVMDMNFYVDYRKVTVGKVFGLYDSNKYVPKEAIGVVGVKHQPLKDFIEESKKNAVVIHG
jgi:hypothetical protein